MIADNEKRRAESKNKGQRSISVLFARAYEGVKSLLSRKQTVAETTQPEAD